MTMLYKHKNNTDVAVEVVDMFRPKGKDYARIKVRWWNIGACHEPWCMNLIQILTDATIKGNKAARSKYPLEKWYNDWQLYTYNKKE